VRGLLVPALVLALLSSAPAADGAKARLFAPDPWKEGETTTEVGVFRQTMRPSVPVGSTDARQRVTSIEYAMTRRCLGVDAAGRWTRGEAAITRWTRTGGASEDRSLEGARLTLEPGGVWNIVSGGEPSAEARQWLQKQFGQKNAMGGDGDGTPPEEAPKDECVVGKPVSVRMLSLEQGYPKLGVPVPADGIFAKYLLMAVEPSPEGDRIQFVQTIDAPLEGVGRSGDKSTTYVSGSEVHQRIECRKTLGRAHAAYSYKLENEMTFVYETPEGRKRNTTSIVETLERTPGGEWPR
jgi:hypothetical protein